MISRRSGRTAVPISGSLIYLGMVMVSTMAVAAADWADNLALVPLVGILGVLCGLALARSLFRGWFAVLAATCYGLFIAFWFLGETLDPAFAFRERLIILGGRFAIFISVISRGLENQDALMVVLLMSLLYWGISVYGAWALFRQKSLWGALVPHGIALLINAYYYLGEAPITWLLALYILLGLLLFLFNELRLRQDRWRELRSRVPANAIVAVARIGAGFALILVMISWVGPAFAGSEAAEQAWQAVSGPWRATRDRLGKVLYSLRSPVLLVGDEFSDRLALDAGTEPGENLVMEVAPQGSLSGPGRYYWRARTYDTYQDGGWQYTGTAVEQFDPRQGKLTLPDYAAREAVKVKIAPNNAVQKSMFVPAHTVWVDRTTDLRVEKEAGQIVDVSAYLSNQPIFRGEVYEAEGSVAVPQADQLRAAGQDYPDWVSQKYLQLPPEVTERTRELARRIAGDLPTAYDQAAAITAWLRSNIEYQRVIDPAPAGREKIDWFIFDYGVGFCNYYASAEVLMLRSLGVPARLAVGYARGEFDSQLGLYTVTAEDYHAWPEVFFPGYGWVEFEPTVSQPVLIRPEPAPEAGEAADESLRSGFGSRGELEELRLERMTDLLNQDQVLPEQNLLDPGSTVPWGRLGLMLLAIAAIAVALWTRLDAGWRLTLNRVFSWTNRVLDRQSKEAAELDHFAMEDSDLGRAYLRWVAWWPRLGMDASRDQTPAERAVIFSRAFPELAAAGQALAQNYQLQRFNPSAAEPADWRSQWSLLQQGLWKAYFNQISGRALSWLTGGETPEHHP